MNFREEAYLMHFGVLGMKWGKRNLRSPDGTLSESSKKKLSKEYKKLAIKTGRNINRQTGTIYVKAYNKTSDEYNKGKTEEYNKKHKVSDPDYISKYNKQFEKDLNTKYEKMLASAIVKDKNYIKARALVKEYDMTSFDDLAKSNEQQLKSRGS